MKNNLFKLTKIIFAFIILAAIMTVCAFASDLRSIIDIDTAAVEKIYFKCETDKDFTRYEVGEEMVFTFTLYADDEQITSPFFKYTMKGDDGQYSDGYADATSGTVILKTKMTKPGALRIEMEIADYAKAVMSDSKITKFEGGAIAGALDLNTTLAEPLDFDAFWAEQLALLDECAPDLFYLEQVESTNANFDTYIVKVNCIGDPSMVATNATWTAGVLTVPKNAEKGTLGFNLTFLGYGVYTATRTYKDNYVTFAVNSHSIEQLQPGAYYDTDLGLKNYGWKDAENASPYTCYFRWMLLRDVQAVRFLQKYFGTDGGESEYNGIDTGAWKGLWNESDIRVSGGSQGGFQALSVAALVPEVTYCEAGVPWMADVGSNTVSTRLHTHYRPNFAKGLLYFDSAFMAKRIKANVVITAGMGDPTCPVYGVQTIYNNLRTDASIRFRQGQTHGQTNTYPIDFTHSKDASEISQFGSDAFYIIGDEIADEFAVAWKKLTARDAIVCEDESALEFASADTKNIIYIVSPDDNFTSADSTSEAIAAINAEISSLGLSSYSFALVGEGSLSVSAQAVLKMAADAESLVHLVALGNSLDGANELAINLSASLFESQPSGEKQFKVIGTDGCECSSFIVSENMSEILAFPIITPLYELKNSGIKSVYLSPEDTGEAYGTLELSGAGVSKKIRIYESENVFAYGNYLGFEWILQGGILTVNGKGSIDASEYPWNNYISSVSEIRLSEGIKSLASGAFEMPENAKIVLPYSLETIDENAFCGRTSFIIAAYDGRIGNTFASENSIGFESLGTAGECGDDVYWRYENETLYIFGTGTTFKSGISTFGGTDSYWSEYHSSIKKVVIGENITSIGALALHNMLALTTVEMTRNVTTLMQGAFESSRNITTIYYKGEEPIIGTADISSVVDFYTGYTFDGLSKIEKYILSEHLNEALLPEVFKGNSKLTQITVPASVTAIGDRTFANCSSLRTLTVLGMDTSVSAYAFANKSSNPTTNYIDNVTIVAYEGSVAQSFAKTNLMKFRNIETGVETDYKALVGETVASGTMCDGITYEIVNNGEEYSLIFTGDGADITAEVESLPYASYADQITKVIIRDGKNIGDNLFANMKNLTTVELNAYVTTLGESVFAGCEKLSSIYIADTALIEGHANLATVKSIGKECFMGTAIESYTLSSAITEIPEGIFKNSALKAAVISKYVTSIGDEAFSGCSSLTDITMKCERYTISENAFDGVPKTATINAYTGTAGETFAKENGFVFNSIGVIVHTVSGSISTTWEKTDWVFDEWTSVLTLTAGASSGWIETGKGSSSGGWSSIAAKVEEVVIEGKYSNISAWAFSGMTKLKMVTLPASGLWISTNAFNGCTSLETICMTGSPCIAGVADLSKVIGSGTTGNLAGGSNILRGTAIKGIILPDIYSETTPIVLSNLPEGLETVYGATEYLQGFAEANGYNFVPIGNAENTADMFLTFEGYQVRTDSYNGLRSRFRVNLDGFEYFEAQGYKILEVGTILAATEKLDENGAELVVNKNGEGDYVTLDFAKKFEIFKDDSYIGKHTRENDNEIVYYCTVTKFTANNYNMNVSIRGYAIVSDADGNEIVLYSDYEDENYRSVNLYQVCVNLAAEGKIDTASCISYIDVMNFKKSKDYEIGDTEITPDSVWN